MKLKEWIPDSRETEAERELMTAAAFQDLKDADPGDHTVFVGQDTLIYAVVDFDRSIHIYETQIRSSNQDFREQKEEGAEFAFPQKTRYVS
jgi:hypothetical protein